MPKSILLGSLLGSLQVGKIASLVSHLKICWKWNEMEVSLEIRKGMVCSNMVPPLVPGPLSSLSFSGEGSRVLHLLQGFHIRFLDAVWFLCAGSGKTGPTQTSSQPASKTLASSPNCPSSPVPILSVAMSTLSKVKSVVPFGKVTGGS